MTVDLSVIERICAKNDVAVLQVFGSAARGEDTMEPQRVLPPRCEPARLGRHPIAARRCDRQLQIIGEGAKRLSPSLKDALSTIPWREVTGMRDKHTHDCMGVDLDAVWKTAAEDLEPLKVAVREALQGAGGESNGA